MPLQRRTKKIENANPWYGLSPEAPTGLEETPSKTGQIQPNRISARIPKISMDQNMQARPKGCRSIELIYSNNINKNQK